MFRLLHISDIHLSPFPAPSWWQLCNKRITGWANWKLNRKDEMGDLALKILLADLKKQLGDHLVISGDLVNLALPSEFHLAREWVAKLGNPHNLSIVFGNHDAYVPGALKDACKTFAPWIRGDKPYGVDALFPYMRVRHQVAIIGASSALATRPFSAKGKFDEKQAKNLGILLDEAHKQRLFPVVAIHHPPLHNATHRHKELKGIDRFQNVIKEHGAGLVLHGHTHLPTLSYIEGKGHDVPVVGVASASQDFGGKKPPANFNLFEIEKKPAGWRCNLTRRGILDAAGRVGEIMSEELYPLSEKVPEFSSNTGFEE